MLLYWIIDIKKLVPVGEYGLRIELHEIEVVIGSIDGITECVAQLVHVENMTTSASTSVNGRNNFSGKKISENSENNDYLVVFVKGNDSSKY